MLLAAKEVPVTSHKAGGSRESRRGPPGHSWSFQDPRRGGLLSLLPHPACQGRVTEAGTCAGRRTRSGSARTWVGGHRSPWLLLTPFPLRMGCVPLLLCTPGAALLPDSGTPRCRVSGSCCPPLRSILLQSAWSCGGFKVALSPSPRVAVGTLVGHLRCWGQQHHICFSAFKKKLMT